MRVAISGSHSLGKSTLVHDFQAAHPDMQDKNGLTFPSDINAAFIEQLWATILDSQALSSYDLIVLLPLTGDPGIDPCMENDGIRSVETAYRAWVDAAFKQLYRHDLPTRSPQCCRVVEISGTRAGRVKRLEQELGIR